MTQEDLGVLWHWAHKYADIYSLDPRDVYHEALWIYNHALQTYKKDKGASFKSWLHENLKWRLQRACLSAVEVHNTEVYDTEGLGFHGEETYNPERLLGVKETFNKLSDEAKQIASLLLESPEEYIHASPRNMRGLLVSRAEKRYRRHSGVWWKALRELSNTMT